MSPSTQQQQQQEDNEQQQKKQKDSEADSDSDSESESESEAESESESEAEADLESDSDSDLGGFSDIPESDNYPEANIKRFTRHLNSRPRRDAVKDCDDSQEKEFDFPKDKENWREADLRELWADAPMVSTKTGWDPVWADKRDWKMVENQRRRGNDPPIAPFYIPYRNPYPAVPFRHRDISNPKALIEELDRIEEFLKWVSYIFADGSSYEGTVWDDAAHGKGVYVAKQGLVRYEGEWLRNDMEGHGVVEVDVPDIEPIPGSELEAEMRAEGKIIKRDFMNPEDREWLEMDIEDSVRLTDGNYEIPFYENDEWIRQFGQKPEKGRYRYAGQWRHGRMHGCGVYEVNERPIFGRFYFGELVEEETDCDKKASVLHAGIAEVAAAKARMFVNKPDGMVREERGPYGDPQHPYFYEEDDVWQAPGFINQFYEVPDYWKTYVHEVDEEREMWLNSFYKAPLRLPMPAELEHWWQNDTPPEFVLLKKEPEPDPDDPSKGIYTEDPVILHTPTGRIINYVDDEEHGIRLFWQPPLKEGEDVDPSKVEFLPLGFDEFYGREVVVPKGSFLKRLVCSIENTLKPWFDKLDKWTEEQKKASKIRRELLEQELELMEAELELEEVLQDLDEALKLEEKEAEKKVDIDGQEEGVIVEQGEEEVTPPKEIEDEEDDEEEEEDEDDLAPSSFGTVVDSGSSKDKKNERGKSPFSTLSITSSGLLSMVPSLLERSFCMWKKERCPPKGQTLSVISQDCIKTINCPDSLTFCQPFPVNLNLRMKSQINHKFRAKQPVRKSASTPESSPSSCQSTCAKDRHKGQKLSRLHWLHTSPETYSDLILSLNIPFQCLNIST